MENINEMKLNWIVAYTRERYEAKGDKLSAYTWAIYEDHWRVCESFEEAQEFYKFLSEESEVWSASLCAVAESWDYDTHPLLKGYVQDALQSELQRDNVAVKEVRP